MNFIASINQMDLNTLLWLQNIMRSQAFTYFWKVVTSLGNAGLVWIVIDLMLLIRKPTRKVGFCGFASLGAAALIGYVLKGAFVRPRPFIAYPQIQALITESGYSFPSGHTITAFANAAAITFTCDRKRYGIAAFILAGMIAFSRLYLGVHYPSDVAAGILLGTAIAFVVCRAAGGIGRRHIERTSTQASF